MPGGETSHGIPLERTFAMIKPDAIYKADEIMEIIEQHGFSILQKRRVQLKPEQTSEFYAEHFGKMFFPSLVGYISGGPVMAMVLAKHNAIMDWRALMGPTNTLKAREIAPNRSATNSTHRQSHDNGNNFQPPHGLIIL